MAGTTSSDVSCSNQRHLDWEPSFSDSVAAPAAIVGEESTLRAKRRAFSASFLNSGYFLNQTVVNGNISLLFQRPSPGREWLLVTD
jgi:hypothetical protein